MIYTDSKGTYFQLGEIVAGDSTQQIVNIRTNSGYQSEPMAVATININIASVWAVASGITDIGAGIWVNGALVDPPAGS